MPQEIEVILSKLDFVADSSRREQVAQAVVSSPTTANPSWLIGIAHQLVTPDGWVDPEQMRQLLEKGLLPRKFSKTIGWYVGILETHEREATPQLFLPPTIEASLLLSPFYLHQVQAVEVFTRGGYRDFSGARGKLLASVTRESGTRRVRDVLEGALVTHSQRMSCILSATG